eukprot:TRINITY_DN25271_c0_g1_i2.p1 TRINITY_DN25271_c0_g1~~TRINITY_DN25271_c0_g1_i2.p1  ORF type:complete len:1115 (-),score=239.92 TRINITY_DN25271_c0_g1_i2:162-3506(-)
MAKVAPEVDVTPSKHIDEDMPSRCIEDFIARPERLSGEISVTLSLKDPRRQDTFHNGRSATKHSVASGCFDYFVMRYGLICSRIADGATGAADPRMEAKFAAAKYKNFRNAFSQVSFGMALGAVGQAVVAGQNGYLLRLLVLLLVIAPIYCVYGIYAMKAQYLKTPGTCNEKLLVALMCFQSLAVVFSEWARVDADYGLLVMHIGFVHNFSPLGDIAIHSVTTIFALAPYVGLKVMLFSEHAFLIVTDSSDDTVVTGEEPDRCEHTVGRPLLLLEVFVPAIILLYQATVTMRRDHAMRSDVLASDQINQKRNELKSETTKAENLLKSMLPGAIIEALKEQLPIEPMLFDDVTVIFVEICDFAALCGRVSPESVVDVLNQVYLELDHITDLLRVYKVETVMQVYMAVVGCPQIVKNHADVAAHFALAAQEAIAAVSKDKLSKMPVDIRVGLNSGRIRAGVVGMDCPRYKLFGDTVNTASRMESTCLPGRVQCSPTTKERLTPGVFDLEDRGGIPIKGKGVMHTAFINGYKEGNVEGRRITIAFAETSLLRESAQTDADVCVLTREDSSKQMCPTASQLSMDSFTGHATSMQPHVHRGLMEFVHVTRRDSLYAIPTRGTLLSESVTAADLFRRLNLVFLLVAPADKTEAWMETLRKDTPKFVRATLLSRIGRARNLTLLWLMIQAFLCGLDYFLDAVEAKTNRYRSVVMFRTFCTEVSGLMYLLLLGFPDFFLKYSQPCTVIFLLMQGISMLSSGMLIYNGEVAVIAMYGAYTLFYTVCTMWQRLFVCGLAVVGYVAIEFSRCGVTGIRDAGYNIGFLVIFFVFMYCGIRLQEHLEHVAHYEQRRVKKRIEDIDQTRAAGLQLLHDLLPSHVVPQVNLGISPIAEHHDGVTVIFTDIKGYTAYSSKLNPGELVEFLNSMYSAFDEVIINWGLHKVEIIGDAYFIAAGAPAQEHLSYTRIWPDEYAMRAVEVALALQRTMAYVVDDPTVQMRVGLHSGPVIAGVVGKKGPRYHLFGQTVSYAEKMESHGIPGRVQVSQATHNLLIDGGHEYVFEERNIEIEGCDGLQRTYMVQKSNAKAAFQIQKKLMQQRRLGRASQTQNSGLTVGQHASLNSTTS